MKVWWGWADRMATARPDGCAASGPAAGHRATNCCSSRSCSSNQRGPK